MFEIWSGSLIILGIVWLFVNAFVLLLNWNFWDTRDEWEVYAACSAGCLTLVLGNIFLLPVLIPGILIYGGYAAKRQYRKHKKESELR